MDWVMQAYGECIRWKDNHRLMDMEFADDITLLPIMVTGSRSLTDLCCLRDLMNE